jgi:hypothetical protein
MMITRELQGVADVVFTGDVHDPVDGGFVEVAGIVDEASALLGGAAIYRDKFLRPCRSRSKEEPQWRVLRITRVPRTMRI